MQQTPVIAKGTMVQEVRVTPAPVERPMQAPVALHMQVPAGRVTRVLVALPTVVRVGLNTQARVGQCITVPVALHTVVRAAPLILDREALVMQAPVGLAMPALEAVQTAPTFANKDIEVANFETSSPSLSPTALNHTDRLRRAEL